METQAVDRFRFIADCFDCLFLKVPDLDGPILVAGSRNQWLFNANVKAVNRPCVGTQSKDLEFLELDSLAE